MTSINGVPGVPIIGALAEPRPGIAIVQVPIELQRDQIVEMKLRAPGIIRAAAFWLKTPSVLGAASMRATEKIAMPLLFVECDPAGELHHRVFLFLPSGVPFTPRDGFAAVYRASAIGEVGALHVYEIVESPS